MASLANFVLETCSAPGVSATVTLAGAPTGRVSFAAVFASGQTVFYFMDDGTQAEWGVGVLTIATPNTFNRTTVIGNTAGTTARLNFSGTTRIYNEAPASSLLYIDAASGLVAQPNAAALDRQVLQSTTIAAAAANFATVFASGFNWYDVEFSLTSDKATASTGALAMQVSANGGSTYSSNIIYAVVKNGTLVANSSASPVSLVSLTCVGDGTFSGRLRISPNAWINLQTSAILAGTVQTMSGAITAASLGNINCINMAFTNGNIVAGGIIRILGGY